MVRFHSKGLLAAVGTLALVGTAHAVPIYGLTTDNALFTIDSATPGNIATGTFITGLQVNEQVVGIDFRPATGELFGIGSTSRVYSINTTTGAAIAVGSPFTPALNGTSFDIDFNPTVDRIRLVSNADQNLRVNPVTGTVANIDGTLTYAVGDTSFGTNPNVAGAAYTNNFAGSTSTTLYVIDSGTDTLDIQNANAGTLSTVGYLGFDVTNILGFDIGSDGTAYVAMQTANSSLSKLYTINLTTGAASLVGNFGGDFIVRDISVALVPEPATLGLAGVAVLGFVSRRRRA